MPAYRARVVDAELDRLLRSTGAVLIEGPKACGKTWTATRRAASSVRLDIDANARQAASIDPTLVLDGPVPRLLDEWQTVPALWNAVRTTVDQRDADGQFILTGSAVPADDITRHSGAMRIARMRMRPMSLFEAGRSSGQVSLAATLAGAQVRAADSGLTLDDLFDAVCRGGWPTAARRTLPDAQRALRDYLTSIARTDIDAVGGVTRDPAKISVLLRSLARNTGTEAAVTTLAALVAGPPALRADLNLFGFLFESLVVRDLRIYAQAIEGQVSHYRDHTGLEVDAIVTCPGQLWAAFEVKLGTSREPLDKAAANLLKFAGTIDASRVDAPAALGVIVGTGLGYVRPDGVAVIPVGCLGP